MSFLASQLGLGTLPGQIKGLLDYVPGQIDKLLTQAVGAFAAKLRGAWGSSATLYDGIMGSPVDFNYGNVAYVLWVASKDGQTPQVLVAKAGASRPIGALKASSFDDTVSPGAQGLLTALVNAAKALAAATKSKQTKASDLVPLEAAVAKAAKPVVSAIQANACVVLNAGCFAAGTKVLTPSGWVAVEELEVGQLVRSRPEDDAHAESRWNAVEARFDRTGCILHLHVGGEVIRTTPEHPFYVFGKGWTEAGALQAGDWLSTLSGGWVAVEEVYDTGCYEPVYNIEVEGDHCYRVGQQGLLVHNASNQDPCNASTVPCYDLFSGCELFPVPFPGDDSPGKTYLKRDGWNRAKGVRARLCKANKGGGSDADNDTIEGWKPGWGGAIVRAHLLPARLGGPGEGDMSERNLVVVCKKTNNQLTTRIESTAYDWVMAGLIVDYQVDVEYQGTSPYPLYIEVRIRAIDPQGTIPPSGVKPCKEIKERIWGVSTDIYDCKDAPPRR